MIRSCAALSKTGSFYPSRVILRSYVPSEKCTFNSSGKMILRRYFWSTIPNCLENVKNVNRACTVEELLNSNSRYLCGRTFSTSRHGKFPSSTGFENEQQSENMAEQNTKFMNAIRNLEEDYHTHEHRVHSHKGQDLKMSDMERLYPLAKSKLHDIYQTVNAELNKKDSISWTLNAKNQIWTSTCHVKWPEEQTFTGVANNKIGATKIAGLKCLLWLHQQGKVKNGKPIIYDTQTIVDMMNQPTPLEVSPTCLQHMRTVIERYEQGIDSIVENENTSEMIADIKIMSEVSFDVVGHSQPDSLQPETIEERNKTLKRRYESRQKKHLDHEDSRRLPIADYRETIMKAIKENQVLLIKGDTGCGKTTQVPQYIMEHFEAMERATDCNMIVSQPRRISAISLAERVAQERKESMGNVVGYQVRLQQKLPRTPASMLFCTTGILLRKLQTNPTLSGCSHVILDEAHERSINTDMLLVLLKRAILANPDLKLIIMSATLNADLFQKFMKCSVCEIPGRTFPVEMNFLEDVHDLGIKSTPKYEYVGNKEVPQVPMVDYFLISKLIHWIHCKKPEGAVLVFLPGWSEIMKVKKALEETRSSYQLSIVPVHSRMSHEDQRKIFQKAPNGKRKVVLATDIAETGITVTDVVYVIDSAIRKAMRWHDAKEISTMQNQYAAQANILQRKGRAGRVRPGISYHLITKSHFDKLDVNPVPEILTSSLEKTVLDCKTYSDEKAEDFLKTMPEPPMPSAIRVAVSDLIQLGALDAHENLTPLGKRIALLTIHPKLSKALVYSSIFQCLSPMVTIASAMSAENGIFTGTLYNKENIRNIKKQYHPTSDHLGISWLFSQWSVHNSRGIRESKNFCYQSQLHSDRIYMMSRVRDLHADNLVQCRMLDFHENYSDLDSKYNEYSQLDELVCAVLLSGMDQFLLRRSFEIKGGVVKKGKPTFIMEDGHKATLTPESVNFKMTSCSSPFFTYVSRQRNEERRTSLIRETSMITPITALLFSQEPIHGFKTKQTEGDSQSDEVLLTIKGRRNFRISCDTATAKTLLHFRDVMWDVVRYLVKRQGLVQNSPGSDYNKVDNFKETMLQVIVQTLAEAAEKSKDSSKSSEIPYDEESSDDEKY